MTTYDDIQTERAMTALLQNIQHCNEPMTVMRKETNDDPNYMKLVADCKCGATVSLELREPPEDEEDDAIAVLD